jgi:hypothetical protein
MRVPVGPDFDDERDRFALRFTCEDCAYALPRPGDDPSISCKHGWPTDEHRLRTVGAGGMVTFCKEFELW